MAPSHAIGRGPPADDRLAALTRANAQEILRVFGLHDLGFLQPLADRLASMSAHRLSRQILLFDRIVDRHGLAAAGRYILDEFTSGAHIEGRQHVPDHGPLLVVSNHPGVVDAMAIWVALQRRSDLKIIASSRDILRLLPGISRHLLFVEPAPGGRSRLLQSAAKHLRQGGTLLNFPAGTIEPDPALRRADTLSAWSASSEVLVRLVPTTVVLPVAVSGVISPAAHSHPMARRFADPREREWAAATLQVLCRHLRRTETRVVVGEAILPGHLDQRAAIRAAMGSLLARAGAPSNDEIERALCQQAGRPGRPTYSPARDGHREMTL